jgi:hypothetical protein
MRAALILLTTLAFGGSAIAAERARMPEPKCESLAKIKADMADAKFTVMSVGQYHFLEGAFASSPITPPGLPPGDGALLIEIDHHAVALWTKGKEVCMTVLVVGQDDEGHPKLAYSPLPISDDLLKGLRSIKTGIKEESGERDHSDELKL